jgi:hypothetical protein
MQFVNAFDLESIHPSSMYLFEYFTHRIGGMQGRDEIAAKHCWCILRMLVHQTNSRLVVGRPQKINDQNWGPRLRAKPSRPPKCDRIRKMMQQAVADDSIECSLLESRIRQVSILENNPLIETGSPNMTTAKYEHRFRGVHANCSDSGKSFCESDRYVCRAASKIDDTPALKLRKPLPEVSGNLPVGFTPVCTSVGSGLLLFVHQFGFWYSFHA